MEAYRWLSWAGSGFRRGSRDRPFDAMLLPSDGGNREVPLWGRLAREDHKRVLRAVISAGWPLRGPEWPALLEGRAVLRVTDAEASVWLPGALRTALGHWSGSWAPVPVGAPPPARCSGPGALTYDFTHHAKRCAARKFLTSYLGFC